MQIFYNIGINEDIFKNFIKKSTKVVATNIVIPYFCIYEN